MPPMPSASYGSGSAGSGGTYGGTGAGSDAGALPPSYHDDASKVTVTVAGGGGVL